MKAVAKSAKKKAATNLSKAKSRVAPGKVYSKTVVDTDGKLPLPNELVKDFNIKAGDKFALWKVGAGFKIVFPKSARSRKGVPKDAQWGKVE